MLEVCATRFRDPGTSFEVIKCQLIFKDVSLTTDAVTRP